MALLERHGETLKMSRNKIAATCRRFNSVIIAVWVIINLLAGMTLGRTVAFGQDCVEYCWPCNGTDGDPWGPQSSHECNYDTQCSCGPDGKTPVPGWCRKDSCRKCSSQSGNTLALQCESEQACKLTSYSLCQNICSP